jgi:hypothetical protein
VVEKVLIQAQEEGKRFSVIVIDSRPLLEGFSLALRQKLNLLKSLRQMPPPHPRLSFYPINLRPPTFTPFAYLRSQPSPPWRTFPSFKRRSVFQSRYCDGEYDGEGLRYSSCSLLRDVQVQ